MRRFVLVVFLLLSVAWPAFAQVEDSGLGLAESLISQGRVDDAEKLALRALESDPDSQEARLVLAKIALTRSDLPLAQDYVDQLMEADTGNPDHHVLQGMVFMFSERDVEATDSFRKALDLGEGKASPDQMASYANSLVLALYKIGEREEALQICLDSIAKYPDDADLYLSCSRLYREDENFEQALRIAEEGLKANPDFPGLYASAALAHAGLGDVEASEAAYQELLRRDPELAQALRSTLDGNRPDEADYQIRTR